MKKKEIERSEEVQDIVEKMPTKFGMIVTILIISLIGIAVAFSTIISYPDVVAGEIVINTINAPIKLITNASGRIRLFPLNASKIAKKGDYLAIIQNSATLNDVVGLNKLLNMVDLSDEKMAESIAKFPKNLSLGELNSSYFEFLNKANEYLHKEQKYLYSEESDLLKKSLAEQEIILSNYKSKLELNKENLKIVQKFLKRDSLLFTKKVLTENDLDRSKINYLTISENQQNINNDISTIIQKIKETKNNLKRNNISTSEKSDQLMMEIISSFNNLKDNIKSWEQKYVLKAPAQGEVQLLKFIQDDEYIQIGEALFAVAPKQDKLFGQMLLPSNGAGKAKIGQRVNIKLTNYPYMEYGSINGIVSSIGLATTMTKNVRNELIETYLVTVRLPKQLVTNYGAKLKFGYQNKGTGEIITKERKLYERLFDNLKYTAADKTN